MDEKLMKDYEEVAEMIENCYGANKENNFKILCEVGYDEIVKNPKLLGLNEKDANNFKEADAFLNALAEKKIYFE